MTKYYAQFRSLRQVSLSQNRNYPKDHCATILNKHLDVPTIILAVHKFTVYTFSYKTLKYKESKLQEELTQQ